VILAPISLEAWKSFFEWGGVGLLALTFVFGAGALIVNSRIAAIQNEKIRQFEKDLTSARTELGAQQTRAATAERSLLELKERIKPRHLTDQQSVDFINALKAVPNGKIKIGYTAGAGDEGFLLMQQLLPLFDKAGWEAPRITSETTSHLEVQVTGIAVMVPGPLGSDPRKTAPPLLKLTPTELAIQRAFSAVGMNVQFQNWFPDKPEELVIGSKPIPATN
jgi:hypothetical protein